MPDKLQDILDIEAELGAHNYAPLSVVLSRGKGVWLWDVDGNRYLDCLSRLFGRQPGTLSPRRFTRRWLTRRAP